MAKTVPKKQKYFDLLDENFWEYYRLNKQIKNKAYIGEYKVLKVARDIFRNLQEMLSETKHGAILRDFGTIVPKDSLVEYNDGIFKKVSKIKSRYLFFFVKEWLTEYYKTRYINNPQHKSKDKKVEEIREPKYHAIMLHFKKVRNKQ